MSDNIEIVPVVVSPKLAAKRGGWSMAKLYQLLAAGSIESFRDGRSRKVVLASVDAYLARQPRHSGGPLGHKVGTEAA